MESALYRKRVHCTADLAVWGSLRVALIKFWNFVDNKGLSSDRILLQGRLSAMDSERSLASLFCSNNNIVAALQTSWCADVSHMLFLLPTVTFSFFSWFSVPSSTIILSCSPQTLLCFHDTCTSTSQIKIFSNLLSYILGGLVDHISLKWNVSKRNQIFLHCSAFVWKYP